MFQNDPLKPEPQTPTPTQWAQSGKGLVRPLSTFKGLPLWGLGLCGFNLYGLGFRKAYSEDPRGRKLGPEDRLERGIWSLTPELWVHGPFELGFWGSSGLSALGL